MSAVVSLAALHCTALHEDSCTCDAPAAGNLSLRDVGHEGFCVTTDDAARNLALCFGISIADLESSLATQVVPSLDSDATTTFLPASKEYALHSVHALVAGVYNGIVDFIVTHMNASLRVDGVDPRSALQ